MNEKEKQEYLEGYKKAKEKGVPFFPDILFKDAVVSLIVFIIIIGLAYFIRAPLEERANPADTNYNPRPEWYFLFLFPAIEKIPPTTRSSWRGTDSNPGNTFTVVTPFYRPELEKIFLE
jgi:quinol-cytochrome oxidoreductase complex cytochrome b subunit